MLVLRDQVPAGVEPAPLRCPKGQDLAGSGWWAFGFPDGDPVGDAADGQVGASLSYGWVRLDSGSRYLIRPGFSGGGLWSPEYQAVVGIVGQAHANGDGRAITLHQADLELPDLKLAALAQWSAEAAGETALGQWGWALDRDPEGARHWRPRARGVGIDSERGWRFRGRAAALTRFASWLDRPQPDRRVLVVTGSPGVGKSAVLGRIVTTADAGIRASLPPDDRGVLASVGSVSCAVHAKGKTALEVAEEIARAASTRLPGAPGHLAPALLDVLNDRPGRRFNVIIDALDEAASPAQARAIIDSVVLPLAETCSAAGAQVAVGTRREDDGGDLLDRFGSAMDRLDLDDEDYFEEEDLADYALACLQLAGDERPGNPYADDTVALPLAAYIASMSRQNFLIAGLIARSHGMNDETPAGPARIRTGATVRSALAEYLQRLAPVGGTPAADLLTALAFAEAPGLPAGLWQLAVKTLYRANASPDDLARFARSFGANFLVETTGAPDPSQPADGPVYRLFHQALNDALLRDREETAARADDERLLARAFMALGRAGQWKDAPDYLLRSLPGHTREGGLADELFTDDAYLLHADLSRLLQVADDASSLRGRSRVRLLRLTPQAITSTPAERAALFSVTEALEDLGVSYRSSRWQAPYYAEWAAAKPRSERIFFKGHQGGIWSVCAVTIGGRALLASGGSDGTVRLWDPRSGEQAAVLEGHRGAVWSVCAVTIGGRVLLASGGSDGTVRLWDPLSRTQTTVAETGQGGVTAVCTVEVDGRVLLASGSFDGTVRLWDPRSTDQPLVREIHRDGVWSLCSIEIGGRALLASGGTDGTVRLWDPYSHTQATVLEGHQGVLTAVCAVEVGGRALLASGGSDGTVRLWDPRSRVQDSVLETLQDGVWAVCPVRVDRRALLASGGTDGTVRLWDPRSRTQAGVFQGHQGGVWAVCAVTVGGRALLASGDDGTVRLWDPGGDQQPAVSASDPGGVTAVCAVEIEERALLASGGTDGTVRLWDPRSRTQAAVLAGHVGRVYAVGGIAVGGRALLASGSFDGTVRLWDPRSGEQVSILRTRQDGVWAVCSVEADGRILLASGGDDGTVWLWDPYSGEHTAILEGHRGEVTALCAVQVGGRALLASGGSDGTVRLWDPRSRTQATVLVGHQGRVTALCPLTVDHRSVLASGGGDGTVELWDPRSGERATVLDGHQGRVTALCPLTVDHRSVLASAGGEAVRLWDPRSGACMATVPTHHAALGLAEVGDSLAIGLYRGILVIRPNAVASHGLPR